MKRDTECTKLSSKNYKATFCFYVPGIERKEVGATLVFPASKDKCTDLELPNPSNNCEAEFESRRCVEETIPVTRRVYVTECKITQRGKKCSRVPPASPVDLY